MTRCFWGFAVAVVHLLACFWLFVCFAFLSEESSEHRGLTQPQNTLSMSLSFLTFQLTYTVSGPNSCEFGSDCKQSVKTVARKLWNVILDSCNVRAYKKIRGPGRFIPFILQKWKLSFRKEKWLPAGVTQVDLTPYCHPCEWAHGGCFNNADGGIEATGVFTYKEFIIRIQVDEIWHWKAQA